MPVSATESIPDQPGTATGPSISEREQLQFQAELLDAVGHPMIAVDPS